MAGRGPVDWAATAPASNSGSTVRGVAVTSARVTTPRPPTWASGRQASHRSRGGVDRQTLVDGTGVGRHRRVGEDHPLGLARRAAGGDHERVAVGQRWRVTGDRSRRPLARPVVDDGGRRHGVEQPALGLGRQALVDRQGGVAGVPDGPERGDEAVASRQIEGDEVGHPLSLPHRQGQDSALLDGGDHTRAPMTDQRQADTGARTIRPGAAWRREGEYQDIRYETADPFAEGAGGGRIAKITIDRPEVRNAFRPTTVEELSQAFTVAREDPEVGIVVLTGEGPMRSARAATSALAATRATSVTTPSASAGIGRFLITDLHVQIRRLPKPVVAMVAGYAIGGGHVLHVICDLTIAADNARFGQTGPRVGSFDGGFGASVLAQQVGQKRAKEIWFLCRQYDAPQALAMGLVNTVVPLEQLEEETVQWCREMLALSPFALRLLKASFHAADDGLSGIQQLAHDTNLLFYSAEEAQEGRNAFREKRRPEFEQFPKRP